MTTLFFSFLVCVVFSMQPGFESRCVAQETVSSPVAEGAVRTLTQSKVQLTPTQQRELREWVTRGGVVRVSSDAAQLFGFQTVVPRERTAARAGQRWGRATPALPWGASTLSWSAKGQSEAAAVDGLPGVRSVFYILPDPDDVLVSDVGEAGIPLLQVQDVGASADGGPEKPLYAAALRSYGQGWVLFAPQHVEARADSRDFVANLTRFLKQAEAGQWKALPASLLAGDPQSADDWRRLQSVFSPDGNTRPIEETDTAQPDATTDEIPPIANEVALPVHVTEAKALRAVWQEAQQASDDEAATSRARATLVLLRARLEMLMSSATGRDIAAFATAAQRQRFFATQEGGAYAPLAAYWNGVIAMQGAQLPLPRSQEAQLQPFSYALPAQEATTWWNLSQNAPLPDGLVTAEVVKARATLAQAAQLHQNDPPWLLFWGTASGTPHYIFLTPQEAAWPGLDSAAPNAPDPRALVYPFVNQFRWRLWQGTSQWWAEETPTTLGFAPLVTRDIFLPKYGEQHIAINTPTVLHTWQLVTDLQLPYLKNGVSVGINQLDVPAESFETALRTQKRHPADEPEEMLPTQTDKTRDFGMRWSGPWGSQEHDTTCVPARVARFQAVRNIEFWSEGRQVPDWMSAGIENLWSLDLADHLEQNRNQRAKWSMDMPAPLISWYNIEVDRNNLGSHSWPGRVIQAARTLSLASEDLDQPVGVGEADPNKPRDYDGPDLEKQDSTIAMRYFYEQYGTGAVIETLQRLGAGETIDQALAHTTELTEQQLLDAAHNATPDN